MDMNNSTVSATQRFRAWIACQVTSSNRQPFASLYQEERYAPDLGGKLTEKSTSAAFRAMVMVFRVIAEVRFVRSELAMFTRKPVMHEPKNKAG